MFMSLDLGNNLCRSALHQLEPVAAVTLINSRGKFITVVITLHPTVHSPPLQAHFYDLQI